MKFKTGDRVVYILPKGNSRTIEVRLPAVVVNVTERRIVIRCDGSRNHRNVLTTSIVMEGAA